MNKKAVSNLVIAVLLILFIIIISGIIFNWVKKSTDISMEKGSVISEKLQECRDFGFIIEEVKCEKEGIISVKITNNKNYDLKEAFAVRLFSTEDVGIAEQVKDETDVTITSIKDIVLKAYETKVINIFKQIDEENMFGVSYKSVNKIEFVPKLFLGGETVFCNNNKIVVDVKDC